MTLTLALLLVACGGDEPRARLRVAAGAIVLEGDHPLRAIRIDLAWDETLDVSDVVAGADAERMNLVRAELDGTTARFLIADTRKIRLPARGELARVVSTGSGRIRILSAEAADDGGALVPVEIEP